MGLRVSCIRGECGCGEGLQAVQDSCALSYPGLTARLVGQACSSQPECDQSYFVDCVDGTCRCNAATGFREPTYEERFLQPSYTNVYQCRPEALSLGKAQSYNVHTCVHRPCSSSLHSICSPYTVLSLICYKFGDFELQFVLFAGC